MKHAALALLAIISFGAFSGGAAAASTMIVGSGPAAACYEAANGHRADIAALRECDSALEDQMLTPRDRAATQNNRGIIQIHRRNASAALADFDVAARLQPAMGESFVNRGAALILMGDYSGAIQSINRGIELGAQEPHEAYFNRAIAYEQTGDLRAAYLDYRHAAELKPDWPAPQTELARFTVRNAH